MPVMGFAKFERFFRVAGGVDVDKDDVKRYLDFVNDAIYDLLLMGQATAKANVRDIIEPWDLPITKGLQECMHQFRALDEEIELRPILEDLAARPAMNGLPRPRRVLWHNPHDEEADSGPGRGVRFVQLAGRGRQRGRRLGETVAEHHDHP